MRARTAFILLNLTLFGCGNGDATSSGARTAGPSSGGAISSGGTSAGGVMAGVGDGGSGPSTMAAGGTISIAAGGAPSPSGAGGAGAGPAPVMTSAPAGYPYDRGVQFDWPQATPMAGKCQPGMYSGTFSCLIDTTGFGTKTEFAGPVSFTLTASASGEFLEISNGTLTGNANGIPFMSDLTGKLDCTTNEIRASTQNGTYTLFIFMGMFVGTLQGRLDRLTETLAGTWTLVPVLGVPGAGGTAGAGGAGPQPFECTGTWSVVRQ